MRRDSVSEGTPETWLPVPGFEGCYEVSSMGRVCRVPRPMKKGGMSERRALSPSSDSKGYPMVTFSVEGARYPRRVHRLVLEAFSGPCPEGMEACHNNGVRTDNRIDNLRWDTRAENMKDVYRHGRPPIPRQVKQRGARRWNAVLSEERVVEVFRQRRKGKSQALIAREMGASVNAINLVLQRKTWAHVKVPSP